jgi:competence CoiA-like predicted nuclease
MIWANKNNLRIQASPKERAICPLCNEEVIAKCGEIKIWHWAHKKDFECDSFGEPETEWHFNWKKKFPNENQEVRIENHRADIRSSQGLIIELQNSSISPEKIREREECYKKMIWMLNGETLAKGLILREKKEIITFRWKHPPQSWWFANKPIYIDIEGLYKEGLNKLFLMKKIYPNIPCGGWGTLISKDAFIIEHGGTLWKK